MTREADDLAWCAEVFADAVSQIADGKDDDELVPIGWMFRQLLDALDLHGEHLARCEAKLAGFEDWWVPAGQLRASTRNFRTSLALGLVFPDERNTLGSPG